MGYPMTYSRVVRRNGLDGGYSAAVGDTDGKRAIAGDLRRLELDARTAYVVNYIATQTGVEPETVRAVLRVFFEGQTDNKGPWGTTQEEYYTALTASVGEGAAKR